VSVLKAWLREPAKGQTEIVFPNARGGRLSADGAQYLLAKHAAVASQICPSLQQKRVTPHVLRHTCAMTILQATKDIRKVSLWLGHSNMQTTEIYTRADPTVKLEALESAIAPKLRSGRFKATDKLIASLKAVTVMRSEKDST
jgi:site-specific recombinase XerD